MRVVTAVVFVVLMLMPAMPGGEVEAAPAYPFIRIVTQPDGSTLAVRRWGDEYANGWETLGGHTVIKNRNNGRWEYALRDLAGELVPSGIAPGLGAPPVGPRLRHSMAALNNRRVARGARPLDAPALALAAPPWAGADTDVLYIMVGFSDTACTFTPAQMQANLFGNTSSGPGNLADFFFEVSHGNLSLQGTVVGNAAGTGCAVLANTHAFYDTGGGSADGLVDEAVALVDGHVNFADYDNDGDGFVDALGIIYAGGGPHDGCETDDGADGSGGDNLWPHSGGTGGTATGDGVTVDRYIINSEVTFGVNPATGCSQIQTIGLFAHEFGHSLGLPDLYDTNAGDTDPVGRWSTMASQYSSTVNLADTPAHYDPWSKWIMGWITPTDYTGQNIGISLDRVEDSGKVAQFLANPGGPEEGGTGEYFLVENRQLVGFDAALPGCGILVWHIEESQTNNQNSGHTTASHRLVDIEEAHGTNDSPNDPGTPFPGTTNNMLFADTTVPTANLYDGSPSGVRIAVLSGCAATMPLNLGLPPADLRLTKSDTPDPVVAGNQLTYQLTVTNDGPGTASNVTVTDTLPAGVEYLADSDSCVNAAGTLTCSLGSLASGASTGFSVQVRVPANYLSNLGVGTANITNLASVEADEPDGNLANNTASASTQVVEFADVRVLKECKPDQPNAAPAGTSTFCEIYVDNVGPSDARQLVVTDRIISNTPITISAVVVSTTSGSPGSCLPATPIGPTSDVTITCSDTVLPAGARNTIRVTFSANDTGDVNDTATATAATPDPDPTNNVGIGRVSFRGGADLAVTKNAAPNPVTAGTNLTYTVAVSNNGPSSAANVWITDALPAMVSFLSATPSQGSCQGGVVPGDPTKPLRCNFGTLANGAGATVVVVVRVNPEVLPGTVLVNNASVASDADDPNNGNNIVSAPTTVQTSADVSVVKTSDAAVYKPSSLVTYQVTVANTGPSTARDVVVTDNLPDAKQAIYQSDTGGCAFSSPNLLTCNMGDLAVGQSRTFFVYVVIKGNPGSVTNTATASSTTADPAPANNTSVRIVTTKGKP